MRNAASARHTVRRRAGARLGGGTENEPDCVLQGASRWTVGGVVDWAFPSLGEFRRKWEARLPGVAWEDDLTEWQAEREVY